MEELTEKEIETVRKYYRLYSDVIPKDVDEIPEFLDSLSKYDKQRHHDDEMVKTDIYKLVDHYITYYEMIFTEDRIDKMKAKLVTWIKDARSRAYRPPFSHYVGYDVYSEEAADLYRYVLDRYYEGIGGSWINS